MKLKQALNLPKELYRHHCLAHKLQLILRNAIKKKDENQNFMFENYILLEKDLNYLYKFHSKSHKNMNHLKDTCREAGENAVRPAKIIDTRWVNSHYKSTEYAHRYIPLCWAKHLKEISHRNSGFSQTQQNHATHLYNFAVDKNAILTLMIQLDLQFSFKGVGKQFQKRGMFFTNFFPSCEASFLALSCAFLTCFTGQEEYLCYFSQFLVLSKV